MRNRNIIPINVGDSGECVKIVMMKMKETIVVEGKDDETLLKSIYEVDIIRTNGTHLSKETLEEIRAAHEDHGVIVFTDPDHPGEEIRRKINEAVPGVKNAFLTSKSRKKNLVGVEHATKQEIEDALKQLDNALEFGIILRAKGIVPAADGKWIHFDHVPGEIDVRYGAADVIGKLCVIGSKIDEAAIAELFGV